jgi:hypothetical protein
VITTLNRFIDPANYHPEAVANADKGTLAELAPELLMLRLGLALQRADGVQAQAAIVRLEGQHRQGYELFQLMTGKLILALWTGDSATVLAALRAWLDARRPAPNNWCHELLDAPELAPYLAQLSPALLSLPKAKRAKITKADRALVKDFISARTQAVRENLPWLRQLGVSGNVSAIAKAYRIFAANQALRELTLAGKDTWPELIIALDAEGAVLGSFIAH